MPRPHSSKKKKRSGTSKTPPRMPVMPAGLPTELLTAGVPLDADLEIERQQRLEGLKARLAKMFVEGRGAEALDQVMDAMAGLERANEQLAWRVLRANRYRFGRSTEKLTREQLRQLMLAFGGDESATSPGAEPAVPTPPEPEQVDDPATAAEPESTTAAPDVPEKKPKKRKRVRSRVEIQPRHQTIVRLNSSPTVT
jgi:hypothetical protein